MTSVPIRFFIFRNTPQDKFYPLILQYNSHKFFSLESIFPFKFFNSKLNLALSLENRRDTAQLSKEKETHAERILEKFACYYSRDYQIPDAPKLVPINTDQENSSKPTIVIPTNTSIDQADRIPGKKISLTNPNRPNLLPEGICDKN